MGTRELRKTINPNVKIDSRLERIIPSNVGKLIKGADVLVDGRATTRSTTFSTSPVESGEGSPMPKIPKERLERYLGLKRDFKEERYINLNPIQR